MNERPTVQGLPADLHDERPGLTAALHSHDDTDWATATRCPSRRTAGGLV
jgi:hypothetical protein